MTDRTIKHGNFTHWFAGQLTALFIGSGIAIQHDWSIGFAVGFAIMVLVDIRGQLCYGQGPKTAVKRSATVRIKKERSTEWIELSDRMPNPEEHNRVLIYTQGHDFAGAQVFDVKAETLNECMYADPEDQPEICKHATHWAERPYW